MGGEEASLTGPEPILDTGLADQPGKIFKSFKEDPDALRFKEAGNWLGVGRPEFQSCQKIYFFFKKFQIFQKKFKFFKKIQNF